MMSLNLALKNFKLEILKEWVSNDNFQLKMESLFSLPDFPKREYDPFASPPDYQLALEHRKATLVGLYNSKVKKRLCECCMLPVNKQMIDLRCNHIQLSFLGTSVVMYFKLLQISIILLVFVSIPLLVLQGLVFNKHLVCCKISSQLLISLDMRVNQPVYFILTGWISFTCLAFLIKRYFQRQIWIIEKNQYNQEDYTLKLSNLPCADQGQIKRIVQLCLGQKVASLDLAFDIHQLHQAFIKRQKLTMRKNKIDEGGSKNGSGLFTAQTLTEEARKSRYQVSQINQQINRLDQILSKYKHYINFTPYKQIGIAFVSFESKSAAQSALKRYQKIIAETTKQVLILKERQIKVEKAMNPKDIIWQNLNSQSPKNNLVIQISAIMIGLIVITLLGIQLADNRLRDQLFNFNHKVMPFFLIFIMYCLFHAIVQFLVIIKNKLNKYSTHTQKNISSFRIYALLNTIFACALPFFLYRTQDQFIIAINFVALIDSLMHPLIKIFNCGNIFERIFGEYIKTLEPHKNYYTQDYLNRLLQGRQFKLGENYHFYLRSFFVLGFFSFTAPLVLIYYPISLILQYIAQKVLLLRTCKTPPKISTKLVHLAITLVLYLPLIFLLGVITFKLKDSGIQSSSYWLQGILFVISLVLSVPYSCYNKYLPQTNGSESFYQAKSRFNELYSTQNPIKKYDGTIYSCRSMPSQKIFSTPQCRDFQFSEEDRSKKEINFSYFRSINRLMSYNNESFDLVVSSEYKRICDS